jgi:hypothetical protein
MATRIYHHPRVAWDFARVAVSMATANDDLYVWFSSRVAEVMGGPYRGHLSETRTRLTHPGRADAPLAEAGLWRARIDDVLREHADLAEDLFILTHRAASRLAAQVTPA